MLVLYQKQFTSVFSTVASYISIIAELRILNREFFLLVYTFSSNKMSNLRVETNLPRSCFDIDQLSAELAVAIAGVSNVPAGSFMVTIVPDAHIRIGPRADACVAVANVSLTIIRTGINNKNLVKERSKKRAAALFPVLSKHLGVNSHQIYFRIFNGSGEHMYATTIGHILGHKI